MIHLRRDLSTTPSDVRDGAEEAWKCAKHGVILIAFIPLADCRSKEEIKKNPCSPEEIRDLGILKMGHEQRVQLAFP